MATLLKIDVSPRGDYSVSRKLGTQFETEWKAKHADGKVISRDLTTTELTFVSLPWIMGAYSDPSAHTPEQKQALKISDDLIAELEAADEYVISTPMYNFGIPAALKAWVDHVVRVGKTFRMTPEGAYLGLLSGKKATVLIASAGDYSPGAPAAPYNLETPYMKHILGFIGVTDVTVVEAGGTYVLNHGGKTIDEFVAPLHDQVAAAAAK